VPQHAAAPFRRSKDFRLQARLALRLAVTAGTWAAALCLVIGSIVLVVSAASPGRIEPLTNASSALQVSRHEKVRAHKARTLGHVKSSDHRTAAPTASSTVAAATSGVVAVFSGHGDQTTAPFRVDPADRWQMQWAYTCPAGAAVGLLVVDAASPTALAADISQSGPAGHGDTWLTPGGRKHQLVVISTCSWTIRVMQQR
jgi:hypothetical protein